MDFQPVLTDKPRDIESHGKVFEGKFVTVEEAANKLGQFSVDRKNYPMDQAEEEKPYVHYTRPGNIFQILRFGLQSENFKNRLAHLEGKGPDVDEYLKEMCGIRVKPGGSYQGKDSISLSRYSSKLNQGTGFYILISPDVKVWGEGERDTSTGYGHGIPVQNVEGDYQVGNPAAYANEVIAANIILPEDIRIIVVDKNVSILSDLSRLTQEQVLVYMQQAKHKDLNRANEDILANARLLANLASDKELQQKIEMLKTELATMNYADVSRNIIALQKDGLRSILGDKELNEQNLRQFISEKFNIQIQIKN